MKRLLVYPFTLDMLPIARYYKGFTEYEDVLPIVEEGSVIPVNQDICCLDGGSSTGIKASADFESALAVSDDVMFIGEPRDAQMHRKYITMAEGMGKKIILYDTHLPEYNAQVSPEDKLAYIPVPIITVMGQGQQCNKFDIQLGLRRTLQKRGYKVSQVGTKRYSAAFGFCGLPAFPDFPLWKKILLYNRFFADIVRKESPDVLIVGIPGGIMPIDKYNQELFGETAIAVSRSLSPDVSILSMYLSQVEDNFLNDMTNYAKYALGTTLDFFHMSNTRLFLERDMRTFGFITTNCDDMPKIARDNMFNVFAHDSAETVYERIVAQLQDNIEVL